MTSEMKQEVEHGSVSCRLGFFSTLFPTRSKNGGKGNFDKSERERESCADERKVNELTKEPLSESAFV